MMPFDPAPPKLKSIVMSYSHTGLVNVHRVRTTAALFIPLSHSIGSWRIVVNVYS